VATLFVTTGILVGEQLLTSLFLQDVTGASPLRAGAEFLPLVVAAAAAVPAVRPAPGTRVGFH
jgi:hypothetical protein